MCGWVCVLETVLSVCCWVVAGSRQRMRCVVAAHLGSSLACSCPLGSAPAAAVPTDDILHSGDSAFFADPSFFYSLLLTVTQQTSEYSR